MVADFSHFALWLAGLASVASAYTTPVGQPSGNAITKPGLNELVPAGSAYTITWEPTTSNCAKVDLVLLRGPSTNVLPLYAIAENVDNSGTYSWTPSTSLQPDVTHYGLQLICDGSGVYQYSTQFGISNPDYSSASLSSGVGYEVTQTRSVHLAITSTSTASSSSSQTWSYPSSSFSANSTVPASTGLVSSIKPSTTVIVQTNTPTVTETPSETTASPSPSATTNAAPATSAAMSIVGLVAAAVAAAFAL